MVEFGWIGADGLTLLTDVHMVSLIRELHRGRRFTFLCVLLVSDNILLFIVSKLRLVYWRVRVARSCRQVGVEPILKFDIEWARLDGLKAVLIEVLPFLSCNSDYVVEDVVSKEVMATERVAYPNTHAEKYLIDGVLTQDHSDGWDAYAPE